MILLLAFFALLSDGWVVHGFVNHQNHGQPAIKRHSLSCIRKQQKDCDRYDHKLAMALTPIGSFCPFRSTAVVNMEPVVRDVQKATPGFAAEFSRIQFDIQLGRTTDPYALRKVADDMDLAVDQWDNLFARLQSTPDFQTKEYAKIAEAHLNNHGTSTQAITLLVRWQSGCMRAHADRHPPPMPPPGLDLKAMFEDAKQKPFSSSAKKDKTPSISAMQAAERITSISFEIDAFESDTVKDEYRQLVRDHSSLIEAGATYNNLDPLEKLSFLDQIEIVEDRWDAFFFRFKLMDSLNQDYIDQCEEYLSSMKLTEDEYRHLLKESHRRMRQDAEKEIKL